MTIKLFGWLLLTIIVLSILIFSYRKRLSEQEEINKKDILYQMVDVFIAVICISTVSAVIHSLFPGMLTTVINLLVTFLMVGLAINRGMFKALKTIGIVVGSLIAILPFGKRVLDSMLKGAMTTTELFDVLENEAKGKDNNTPIEESSNIESVGNKEITGDNSCEVEKTKIEV